MNSRRSWFRVMQSFCMVIVIGFIVYCPMVIAQGQDQLQEIWQNRISKETKQFADFLKSRKMTSYTCSTMSKLLVSGKMRTFHARQVVKRKGSFWLLNSEGDVDDPLNASFNRCYGFNSKYAFMLKKSRNGKDWVVQNITEATPDLDETKLFGMKFKTAQASDNLEPDGLRAIVNSIFDLLGRSNVSALLLSDTGSRVVKTPNNGNVEFADRSSTVEPWKIAELPGFRLSSISVDGPRKNILHVNFDYEVMDMKRKKNGVTNCQMDFDLEAQCYPIKSHQVLRTGMEETILDWSNALNQTKKNEYELKSFVQLNKKSNSAVALLEETQEDTIFSLNDLPESDFTLTAFGFPEPPGIEWKKPFPWYLLFAGIGTVCLGIFFFLRSRSKRLKV